MPESRVELAILRESLRDLPSGASFTGKKGQANVKVSVRNDTLYVAASCDSLRLLCESYERELTHIRSETQSKETGTKKPGLVQTAGWLSLGILGGLTLSFLIRLKTKK